MEGSESGGQGSLEEGEEAIRKSKKGRPEGDWVPSDGLDMGSLNKGISFKEKLVESKTLRESTDSKGSKVFDEAWSNYIDGLKGFFSGANKEQNGVREDDSDDEDWVTIDITQEEYERWCAPWKKSLIVKLLGKSVPFWFMKRSLEQLWKTTKAFTMRDLDNGFYIVSFEEEEDFNYVYQEGPWMISDRYLIVQRWRPNFDCWGADCQRKIVAWIRIPLLPLEFFNVEALRKIGAGIGRTLKLDSITHTSKRGRFARICVELDLKLRLKSSVRILG